jgi:hypothetical protein
MSRRGSQLLETANGQISGLIDLLSARGEGALSLPCPGREKMGDGTVAATASHTADNYQLIARFLQASSQMPDAHAGARQARRRAESGHAGGPDNSDYTAEKVDLRDLLERLSAGRDALSLLADMTDERLDNVPAAGSFRFCDGQRTLEQVVATLLNHQSHQTNAIKAAVT